MTTEELAKMTPEAKCLRIAELCGWNYHKRETFPKRRPKQYDYLLQAPNDDCKVLPAFTVASVDPSKERIIGKSRVPDYLNSLDAMREAEQARLPDLVKGKYWAVLMKLETPVDTGNGPELVGHWNSTATQRADAFLLCVG